jgi:hypothetical protein
VWERKRRKQKEKQERDKKKHFSRQNHKKRLTEKYGSGAVFTTLYFLRNLQMGRTSWSVYPWQAFAT